VSAVHRATGTKVAIKKVAPFEHSMFALRTLRELKLLKFFAEEQVSENVSARDVGELLRVADEADYHGAGHYQAAIVRNVQ
jgi:hypothetical protein